MLCNVSLVIIFEDIMAAESKVAYLEEQFQNRITLLVLQAHNALSEAKVDE
jgi:hypothetical protein